MKLYFDNAATTKVDERVVEAMMPYFSSVYGNPSSLHGFGVEAEGALRRSRGIVAGAINAGAEEIFFTSGGTEANGLALKGVALANREKGNHIVTTKVEHKSVLENCKWLEKNGFDVSYVGVDSEGFVNFEELKNVIREGTILVSVIQGNNEVGTINGLEKIGRLCKERGVYFHTDACQGFTKTDLDVKKMGISLASLNAHKIHGPKGVGALYVGENVKIGGLQLGGWQEKGVRAGTENVAGIVGFAKAIELALMSGNGGRIARMRDKLIEGVLGGIRGVSLNGARGDKRLCNNANFSFRFIEGESIVGMLDLMGIAASTGSACSERTLEPSYVLKALGLDDEGANGSLRISLSRFTTEEEIDYFLEVLPQVVKKLRDISPFKEENYVLERNN
ncbi:MAG: cysteine desulfurase family protein [archaeon]